eukprot:COSAG02_NODE_2344_length_9101_cov_11.972117_2_plen_417_part_00
MTRTAADADDSNEVAIVDVSSWTSAGATPTVPSIKLLPSFNISYILVCRREQSRAAAIHETADYVVGAGVAGSADVQASRDAAVAMMAGAFHRSGLCLITGHGVAAELRQRVYDAALAFFHRPRQEKVRFASEHKGTPGWMDSGQQSLGQTLSEKPIPADMNEFLIVSTGAEGHPESRRQGRANSAGSGGASFNPTVPPELVDLFEEYTHAMNTLNVALMRMTATALGQPEEFFLPQFQPGQYTLQLRFYPSHPPAFTPQLGQMRIGAHADSNGFTIVRLDDQPGLQVRVENEEGERRWVAVAPPAPPLDALVVNTGRMIERWTGRFFKAAVHRVAADPETMQTERLSLAFFSSPNKTTLIETIGPAAAHDNIENFPPILAGELSDAHYLAAYNTSGEDGVPVNLALRKLGERQVN